VHPRPSLAKILALQYATMVLKIERIGFARVVVNLVDALSIYGEIIRKEASGDLLVHEPPLRSSVVAPDDPDGGDSDPDFLPVAWMNHDRVEAQASVPRLPFFSGLVVVQTIESLPRSG